MLNKLPAALAIEDEPLPAVGAGDELALVVEGVTGLAVVVGAAGLTVVVGAADLVAELVGALVTTLVCC